MSKRKILKTVKLALSVLLSAAKAIVSGRYRHGKPTKPVNPPLLALQFQSYIISVCF